MIRGGDWIAGIVRGVMRNATQGMPNLVDFLGSPGPKIEIWASTVNAIMSG